MVTGVYSIRNKVNGKVYIGSTCGSFSRRWEEHRKFLRLGRHPNRHLQAAWNKYGPDAFTFDVLEPCEPDECLEREQKWIDALNSANDECGYNICPKAGNCRGRKVSESQRRRHSLAILGKKHSVQTKERMSIAQSERWTPEMRADWSGKMRGRTLHKQAYANRIAALRTPEVRKKLSASLMGRVVSQTTRNKIASSNRGKPVPPERRDKIAATLRGRTQSESHRAKRRATMGTSEFRERMAEIKRRQFAQKQADIKATEALSW